jgi:hypothetical protein
MIEDLIIDSTIAAWGHWIIIGAVKHGNDHGINEHCHD